MRNSSRSYLVVVGSVWVPRGIGSGRPPRIVRRVARGVVRFEVLMQGFSVEGRMPISEFIAQHRRGEL